MNRNSNNEHNSSVLQALLDLEKVLTVSPDAEATKVLKPLKTVIKHLQTKQKFLTEADKIFNQHRYNDKKVHFTKMQNFKKCQVVVNLTERECKVLLYMIGVMSQQNMVGVKQTELVKELKSGKREIINALKGLEKKGVITKVFTDKKRGIGTVYMVNPEVASVGKQENHGLFQKVTPSEQLNEFLTKTNNCTYGVTHSETDLVLSDNTPITVRYNFTSETE